MSRRKLYFIRSAAQRYQVITTDRGPGQKSLEQRVQGRPTVEQVQERMTEMAVGAEKVKRLTARLYKR